MKTNRNFKKKMRTAIWNNDKKQLEKEKTGMTEEKTGVTEEKMTMTELENYYCTREAPDGTDSDSKEQW